MTRHRGEKLDFTLLPFIDARLGIQKPAGFTRVGASNRAEGMFLPKNFGAYCDSVLQKSGLIFNNSAKFIPVLNQVTVQETHGGGREFSIVSVAIDYYKVNNDVCFLFYSSFVKLVKSNGFDITRKHSRNLSDAFALSLKNLDMFIKSNSPSYGRSRISVLALKDSVTKYIEPRSEDEKLKDGVYFSCRKLLSNCPNTQFSELTRNVDTTISTITFPDQNSFFNSNSFFAFVKDNVLYMQLTERTYQKSELSPGSNFSYFKNLTRTSATTQARLISGGLILLFGIPGSIAGSAIRASSVKTERINDFPVDLETGLIDIKP